VAIGVAADGYRQVLGDRRGGQGGYGLRGGNDLQLLSVARRVADYDPARDMLKTDSVVETRDMLDWLGRFGSQLSDDASLQLRRALV
jgi:hypothetical protein